MLSIQRLGAREPFAGSLSSLISHVTLPKSHLQNGAHTTSDGCPKEEVK